MKTFAMPDPPSAGYKRQWVKCNTCDLPAFYDYVPYSLANPIKTMPCRHDIGRKFHEATTGISEEEAIKLLGKLSG